jgi:hypothetical protein
MEQFLQSHNHDLRYLQKKVTHCKALDFPNRIVIDTTKVPAGKKDEAKHASHCCDKKFEAEDTRT